MQSLEAGAEDDRRLSVQLELLKKDKSKLLSQLTAQETVIEGLRAERRLWGQELAQQGTQQTYYPTPNLELLLLAILF